jgi:radical SAM superfamily enzyme YgiQ (UPF0313 family)
VQKNNQQFDILLCALNSRYHHTSFALKYLYANLKELQSRTRVLEYVIQKSPRDIVEEILSFQPRIVGFSVYIWNTSQIYEVVSILKTVAPEISVVLGGPEISHETEGQPLTKLCDYVIKGEADFLFHQFCQQFLRGVKPDHKIITGPLPEIKSIELPYDYYTDEDIKNRVIYVEASRGCPYKCEYCLSSLDASVRNFELEKFLLEMDKLIARGARQFKFIDRTFNLSPTISAGILQFFLKKVSLGIFLHFEMVPDRLPSELRELIRQFPEGSLQFEIGIQTMNPEVGKNVSRRQDYEKIKENLRFLKHETGVHTHADLIVGLPGETLDSFARGFDVLAGYEPDEIQVGILKKLKGTPIARHDKDFSMTYASMPPFQILKNTDIDYSAMQDMNRFAQFWDLYANSGRFLPLMEYFKTQGLMHFDGSLFALFSDFSNYLHKRHQQSHGISLVNLRKSAKSYLMERFFLPEFQAEYLSQEALRSQKITAAPERQQRHLS